MRGVGKEGLPSKSKKRNKPLRTEWGLNPNSETKKPQPTAPHP